MLTEDLIPNYKQKASPGSKSRTGCDMAQRMRVLLLKSNGMTSIPGTHVMVNREDRLQLIPDLHTGAAP